MHELDGLWFVNSAVIAAPGLSVYTPEERVRQMCDTISDIQRVCPNSFIVMFDSSPTEPTRDLLSTLYEYENFSFLYFGNVPHVREHSKNGERSLAECISFDLAMKWVRSHGDKYKAKRVYKLSGRYRLTENFVLDRPHYKDNFVFATSEASWMPTAKIINSGAERLYKLRLWHMDYNLFEKFFIEIPQIYTECKKHGLDVEHAYWKRLHKYKVIEKAKIGVRGNIGPNGTPVED